MMPNLQEKDWASNLGCARQLRAWPFPFLKVMQFYDRTLRAFAAIQSPWRRTQPRIVMTLLCRNESDIIAEHVTFHLAMGVDFILATDNVSSDRTVEILEHFEKLGKLRLLRAPRYEQAKLMTHMARLAAIEHGADWVINSDADEFWWPRQHDLKTTLASLGVGREHRGRKAQKFSTASLPGRSILRTHDRARTGFREVSGRPAGAKSGASRLRRCDGGAR